MKDNVVHFSWVRATVAFIASVALMMAQVSPFLFLLMPGKTDAATYYWDGNNNTTGYGTAGGTWSAPTSGTTTKGWSTSATGTVVVNGNSSSARPS